MPTRALCFDTNAVGDLLLGKLDAWLVALDAPGTDFAVYVSSVTVGEVEFGLESAPKASLDRDRIRRGLSGVGDVQVINVDVPVAQTYGRLKAQLFAKYAPRTARGRFSKKVVDNLVDRVSGQSLGVQENDLWIVATAKTFGMEFVTRDDAGGMRRIIDVADHALQTIWIPKGTGVG